MEEELIDISSTLLEIYKKNLGFLEKNFNELYLRIEELSQDINRNKYSPKYSLEYLKGYFDILNLETNSYFYGTNSYEEADTRASHSDFTKDGSLDLLRRNPHTGKLLGGDEIEDIMPIISYINSHVDFKNIEFEKIYKFVFIGTGLGFHLNEINKKLNPFTTLIIEPEIEVFRLSLFTIDYTEFQKENKKLFLSIGEDRLERTRTLDDFYSHHNYMNYNIKHHLLIENDRYLFDELVGYFSTNTATSFPYVHTIENVFKILNFIIKKYKFLNYDTILEKKILQNKKVLLVAAGPSLDNYIEWIQRHQNKFTIVCVDVILRKLEKHKIVPDIVFSIDPSYMCAKYLSCEDKHYLNASAVVFLAQQHKDVLEIVSKNNVYISQSIPLIQEIGYLGSVSNVGTFSYLMAIHLGANEIYTIGNDAAYHQETGSRYSADSSYMQSEILDGQEDTNNVTLNDIVEVKGNLRDIVKTNRSLLAFKDSFESTTFDLKKIYDFQVFNMSDGVYMETFEPINMENMDKIVQNTQDKIHNILEEMDSISEVLKKPDYSSDKNKIINMIAKVKRQKKLRLTSKNNLLEHKLDLMMWILEQSKLMKLNIFGNIFLLYTELADIYINFLLNLRQKELQDEKHLNEINKFWCDGVLSVLNDFKKISEK